MHCKDKRFEIVKGQGEFKDEKEKIAVMDDDFVNDDPSDDDFVVDDHDDPSDDDFVVDDHKSKKRKQNTAGKSKVKVSKKKTSSKVPIEVPTESVNQLRIEDEREYLSSEIVKDVENPQVNLKKTNVTESPSYCNNPVSARILDQTEKVNKDSGLSSRQLLHTKGTPIPSSVQEIAKEYDIKIPNIVENLVGEWSNPEDQYSVNNSPNNVSNRKKLVEPLPSQIPKANHIQIAQLCPGNPRHSQFDRRLSSMRGIRKINQIKLSARAPSAPRLNLASRGQRLNQIRIRHPGLVRHSTPILQIASKPRRMLGEGHELRTITSSTPHCPFVTNRQNKVRSPVKDLRASPSHDDLIIEKVSSLGCSIVFQPPPTPNQVSLPNLGLPPGITITRTPRTSMLDGVNHAQEATVSLCNVARALKMLGNTEGRKRLVQYELSDSQVQGLRKLGIFERGV